MNELKPCPFCGKDIEMTESGDKLCYGFFHKDRHLTFDSCPLSLGAFIHRVSRAEAIAIWNRRAE